MASRAVQGIAARSEFRSLGFRHAELMTLMHYAGTTDGTKCSKLPWVTFRCEATESKKLKPPPGQMLSFGFRGPGLHYIGGNPVINFLARRRPSKILSTHYIILTTL